MIPFSTLSGKQIDLSNPDVSQIGIYDIVDGLLNLSRYNGQTNPTWSVGQHTLAMVSYMELKGYCRDHLCVALIHDFPEYALGDIAKPLKELIGPEYERLTTLWEDAICERFGVGTGDTFRDTYAKHVQSVDMLVARSEMKLCGTGHPPKETDDAMDKSVEHVLSFGPRSNRVRLLQLAQWYLGT